MMKTIGGATFELRDTSSGHFVVCVVDIEEAPTAVEVILEIVGSDWTSGVLAISRETPFQVPYDINCNRLRLRVFDCFAREIGVLLFSSSIKGSPAIDKNDMPGPIRGRKPYRSTGIVGLAGFALVSAIGYVGGGRIHDALIARLNDSTLPGSRVKVSKDLAVLSRSANIRREPVVSRANILSALRFGTELTMISTNGEYFEVVLSDGQRGYVHRDVVADSVSVKRLGSIEPMLQAKGVSADRVSKIRVAGDIFFRSKHGNQFDDSDAKRIEEISSGLITSVVGDEISGRYFHYLAEEANVNRNTGDAVSYFLAASLSNPLAVGDVHGWGITQLRHSGSVDYYAVVHALVLAPRAANTWVMVAGYCAGLSDDAASQRALSALKVAFGFSKDRDVTRKFLADLLKAPIGKNMQNAIFIASGQS